MYVLQLQSKWKVWDCMCKNEIYEYGLQQYEKFETPTAILRF